MNLEREGARTEENRRMLAAFRWNLRVLSYIALAVGAFLIYNTISVSVVRRRFEIGILRALGATRAGVLAAFLGEAAAFGLAGAAVGIVLGRLMAEGAVKLVAATVESLYVSSRPGAIALTWRIGAAGDRRPDWASRWSPRSSPAWEASLRRARRSDGARAPGTSTRVFIAAGIWRSRWRLRCCAWLASRQPPIEGKPLFGYLVARSC